MLIVKSRKLCLFLAEMSTVAPSATVPEKKEEKQYVSVVEMFVGVEPSFKRLLLSAKPELQSALEQIDPNNISPRVSDILEFARYVPVSEIRAVILMQDPYPNVNHAHGLCASTREKTLPPTLKNIYDCLLQHGHLPKDAPLPSGLLISWAVAGVLLINMALTTEIGKSNAHKDTWHPYMKKIVAAIGALDQHIAYLLWGNPARAMAPMLVNNGKSLILTAVHPSPLSQAALADDAKFRHCNHFDATNEFLRKAGRGVIDWNPAATHVMYTDGSASGNGQGAVARGGYATYFTSGPLKSLRLTGRFGPEYSDTGDEVIFPSNIRAEGLAIIHGLEYVDKCRAPKNVEVVTDSEFWINMVEKFIPKWVRTSTSTSTSTNTHETPHFSVMFADRKNPDLVARIWTVVCKIRASCGKITFRHVYSHGKDAAISPIDKHYNNCVDRWAEAARNAEHFHDTTGRE